MMLLNMVDANVVVVACNIGVVGDFFAVVVVVVVLCTVFDETRSTKIL